MLKFKNYKQIACFQNIFFNFSQADWIFNRISYLNLQIDDFFQKDEIESEKYV